MPELWTTQLVTIPVSAAFYYINHWSWDLWLFWNSVIVTAIALVYLVEMLRK